MNWGRRFKNMLTRNWREKLVAVLLAFLFWYMIKAQAARSMPYMPQPPGLPVQLPRL